MGALLFSISPCNLIRVSDGHPLQPNAFEHRRASRRCCNHTSLTRKDSTLSTFAQKYMMFLWPGCALNRLQHHCRRSKHRPPPPCTPRHVPMIIIITITTIGELARDAAGGVKIKNFFSAVAQFVKLAKQHVGRLRIDEGAAWPNPTGVCVCVCWVKSVKW